MKIKIGAKHLEVKTKSLSTLGMVRGLMFRSKNTDNLLFNFNHPKVASIHSFFVFFDFLALWINENKTLIKSELVKPFTIHISAPKWARYLIEVPINKSNKKLIEKVVDKKKDLNISFF